MKHSSSNIQKRKRRRNEFEDVNRGKEMIK
jgi:hypothetical protein